MRLSATATNEASATTAVVARTLAVILSACEILEWSTAAQVVDTVVIAARNPRIEFLKRRFNSRRQAPYEAIPPLGITKRNRIAGSGIRCRLADELLKLIQTVFER